MRTMARKGEVWVCLRHGEELRRRLEKQDRGLGVERVWFFSKEER